MEKTNAELLENNEILSNENLEMDRNIAVLIQRIKVSNLLKDIDIEEMQLLARSNNHMKRAFEDMITKWEAIISQDLPGAPK